MTSRIPRLAAVVFGVLFALATVNVATARADDDPVLSTTCGAGTVEQCGMANVMTCDWSFDFSYGGGWNITVRFSKTNCHKTGEIPIFKDLKSGSSVLSGSCSALSPLLGMPAGTGCSDEDEM